MKIHRHTLDINYFGEDYKIPESYYDNPPYYIPFNLEACHECCEEIRKHLYDTGDLKLLKASLKELICILNEEYTYSSYQMLCEPKRLVTYERDYRVARDEAIESAEMLLKIIFEEQDYENIEYHFDDLLYILDIEMALDDTLKITNFKPKALPEDFKFITHYMEA